MTPVIFEVWILMWDHELRAKGGNIVLILENFSGHSVSKKLLTDIKLEFFKPNLTAHVEPLDAGIIHAFKCHYCKRFLDCAFQRLGDNVTANNVYHIDILTAARLAKLAWHSCMPKTIKNCWSYSGIIDLKDSIR